ncbi:MAG: hypothetical protein WC748_06285 [Legionellales bacterium]|jgi:hypothetical protein
MPSFFNSSNLSSYASSAANSLGFVGNRLFDGAHYLSKKLGLAKVDQTVEDYCLHVYWIAAVPLAGHLLPDLGASLTGEEDVDYSVNNPLVPLGMCLGAVSALILQAAVLHYQKISPPKEESEIDLREDFDSESERFSDRLGEFTSHTIGIFFYNFVLTFVAVASFLKPEENESESDLAFAGRHALATVVGYIYGKCELALHESNLNAATQESNLSIFSALYNCLVTDVAKEEGLQKILVFWVAAGILGSHTLGGLYPLTDDKSSLGYAIPSAIKIPLYFIIPIGAISHSVSEIQAYKTVKVGLRRLQGTYVSLDLWKKSLFITIACAAKCSNFFHVIPEAVAFPRLIEMLGGKKLDKKTHSALTCVSGFVFGVPDLVTTFSATTLPALRKLFGNAGENNPGAPLLINVNGTMVKHQEDNGEKYSCCPV